MAPDSLGERTREVEVARAAGRLVTQRRHTVEDVRGTGWFSQMD